MNPINNIIPYERKSPDKESVPVCKKTPLQLGQHLQSMQRVSVDPHHLSSRAVQPCQVLQRRWGRFNLANNHPEIVQQVKFAYMCLKLLIVPQIFLDERDIHHLGWRKPSETPMESQGAPIQDSRSLAKNAYEYMLFLLKMATSLEDIQKEFLYLKKNIKIYKKLISVKKLSPEDNIRYSSSLQLPKPGDLLQATKKERIHRKEIKRLIAKGACVTERDEKGNTPHSIAIKRGAFQIAKLLHVHGDRFS